MFSAKLFITVRGKKNLFGALKKTHHLKLSAIYWDCSDKPLAVLWTWMSFLKILSLPPPPIYKSRNTALFVIYVSSLWKKIKIKKKSKIKWNQNQKLNYHRSLAHAKITNPDNLNTLSKWKKHNNKVTASAACRAATLSPLSESVRERLIAPLPHALLPAQMR